MERKGGKSTRTNDLLTLPQSLDPAPETTYTMMDGKGEGDKQGQGYVLHPRLTTTVVGHNCRTVDDSDAGRPETYQVLDDSGRQVDRRPVE